MATATDIVRYLTDRQVAARYAISRQSVWEWVKIGVLPEPIRITGGCTRWDVRDLDEADSARRKAR